jgi:hypothetical protein
VIKDQKELAALLKLCRKAGVTEITFEGVSIKFGDLPARTGKADEAEADEPPDPNVDPMTGLTTEQLAFFSVNTGGHQ